MTKEKILDLILFLKDKEYRISTIKKEVIVWLDFSDIQEFTEIFGYDDFCEGGTEVTLLYESIVFDLYDFLYGEDEEDINYIIEKLKQFVEEE